jgi:hypothetical protein
MWWQFLCYSMKSSPAPSAYTVPSLLLAGPVGPQAGYGHFAEVYRQLQSYKSERWLGAVSGHRLLRHCAHAGSVLVGNAAKGEGHKTQI